MQSEALESIAIQGFGKYQKMLQSAHIREDGHTLMRMSRTRNLVLAGMISAASLLAAPAAASAVTTSVQVVAAGDIACASDPTVTATTCQQQATADVITSLSPRYVLALGDLVYNSGTLANFQAGYDPSWGQFKSITKPVPGNHERGSSGLAGYYQYFGSRATPQEPTCRSNCKGYYSFSTGSWHVVALNTSSCSESAGTCGDFTAQIAWLRADLAAHPALCTLVIVHNPLWSYGSGATPLARPLYSALYEGGADLVLTGHAHRYERFAAQNMFNQRSTQGLTEIVVGTGGVSQQPVGSSVTNRLAAFSDFGVLNLSLRSGGWTSSFASTSGAVRDPSSGTCHR